MLPKNPKQNTNILAIIIAFSVLLPVFSFVGEQTSISLITPKGVTTQRVKAVVVNFHPLNTQQVSILQNPKLSKNQLSTCQNGSVSNLLVQNQATVNLNQPSSCFTFSPLVSFERQTINLTISQSGLFNPQVSVVNLPVSKINALHLKKTGPVPYLPAVPLLVFALASGIFLSSRRLSLLSLNFLKTVKQSLTLQQLQVMRC